MYGRLYRKVNVLKAPKQCPYDIRKEVEFLVSQEWNLHVNLS